MKTFITTLSFLLMASIGFGQQQSFVKGESRKSVNDKQDYEIAYLLPFNKEQVIKYLAQTFFVLSNIEKI